MRRRILKFFCFSWWTKQGPGVLPIKKLHGVLATKKNHTTRGQFQLMTGEQKAKRCVRTGTSRVRRAAEATAPHQSRLRQPPGNDCTTTTPNRRAFLRRMQRRPWPRARGRASTRSMRQWYAQVRRTRPPEQSLTHAAGGSATSRCLNGFRSAHRARPG